jgi:hypothetical protein
MQLALASLLLVLSVSFEGPTELNTPQEVRLEVTGLPEIKSLEQIQTIFATEFKISAPKNSYANIFQRRLVFNEDGTSAFELVIDLDVPGVYVVMGPDISYHRITVGDQDPEIPITPIAPTRAIYVYEKDQGSPPAAISQALHILNQEHGIFAIAVDQHVTGAPQEAIQAAQAAGLPSLVLLDAEGTVIKIIRRPTTEAHIYGHVLPN